MSPDRMVYAGLAFDAAALGTLVLSASAPVTWFFLGLAAFGVIGGCCAELMSE